VFYWHWAMSKSSKNKDAAWEVMKWLNTRRRSGWPDRRHRGLRSLQPPRGPVGGAAKAPAPGGGVAGANGKPYRVPRPGRSTTRPGPRADQASSRGEHHAEQFVKNTAEQGDRVAREQVASVEPRAAPGMPRGAPVRIRRDAYPLARLGLEARTRRLYLVCLAPALLVVCLLVVVPLGYQIYLAARFQPAPVQRPVHRGPQLRKLLQDPCCSGPIWNTILFTVVTTTADFVIAMGMALVVSRLKSGLAYVMRAVILLPMMVIPVAVAVLCGT